MPHPPSSESPDVESAISVRIAAVLSSLTPIHRRMGEYVLANPFRAATMHIDELANAVGASVATANRFARALGFDGYPALRAALVRGFEATLAPVERLRSAQEQEAAMRGAELIDAAFTPTSNAPAPSSNARTSRPRSTRSSPRAASSSSARARAVFSPA
jgi:hypothetical protein